MGQGKFKKNTVEFEDWTFVDADTRKHIHGIHPYPARMIPQVARRLVERYSKPGDTVLDPFCGSGSVLVEAKLLNRHSVGIDINPLACLLAKVKTTLISGKRLRKAWERLQGRLLGQLPLEKPQRFFNIEYWFKEETARSLLIIKEEISKIPEKDLRDFFYVSRMAREASLTRNKEFKLHRMPKEQLAVYHPNVFELFAQQLKEF